MVQGVKAIYGFFVLTRDPSQLQKVFSILDSLETGDSGMQFANEFLGDARFAAVFETRPTLSPVDLQALGKMPEGTLGRSFAEEIRARGLRLDDVQMRPDDGTPAGYVFKHLRETHDVWHCLTGFDIDVPGELGLQAFYLAQFDARISLIILAIGFLNTFFYRGEERVARMDAIAKGWQMGRAAKPLFGVDWAAHWGTPLETLRAQLGLPFGGAQGAAPALRANAA